MERRMYLSKTDNKIAGVCGGIAEYFGIDPTIVRLLWLVMIFAYGTGIMIYIVAAIIMPEREGGGGSVNLNKNKDSFFNEDIKTIKAKYDDEKSKKVIGIILIALGVILFSKRFIVLSWLSFKLLFPLILIVVGISVLSKGWKK